MSYKNIDGGKKNGFNEIPVEENKNNVFSLEGEPGVDEDAIESLREQNQARIMEIYEEREKEMSKLVKEAKEEIKKSGKGIKEAIKGPDGIVGLSYDVRRGLERTQEQTVDKISDIEAELGNLEYGALKVSEKMEEGKLEVVEFKKEITDDVNELKSEAVESIDELKDKREAFVEKFIKESIDGIEEKFEKTFRGVNNKENAENIIAYKTEKEIRLAAKRFIEIGDEAEFGFEANMEISSYETEERGKIVGKKFITGYTIKIGNREMKIRAYDKPLGASLVGTGERKKIRDRVRSGGEVKEKKKKIA